ncbi:MAG: tetratricopeptide repeat protein [Cytophagales bacterium]|nr:tetratricopeptide repeat protein [Armatimonadota bacterium]
MAPEQWHVALLGGFCITRNDSVGDGRDETRIAHFRTRKTAALLAYLVLNPRRHSRDTLTDTFWPDADFDAARASFRVALSHLRKSLGETFLGVDRNTIGIVAPFACDVTAFEQASRAKRWDEARRLYKGPLLPGFWEDWIVAERERLEVLYETVLQQSAVAPLEPPLALPVTPSRFFGREDEIEQMASLLTENRLVTLLGAGGIGKTRLSIAAARRHAALFPGGVWFVPLEGVREAERILPAVRDALGLPRDPKTAPLEQIARCLIGPLPCLLVLDNFEQVAALGAPTVSLLLARVPNLTCLVSSRRRLGVPGERQKSVAPLPEAQSVALFRDRAGEADLSAQAATNEAVAALCRDLEGVPLAIELCAARAGVFTVTEMRVRLAERFALLTSSDASRTLRHRSLFAAMDWSYRLLTLEQRRFFVGLSVFRGGWTHEAAESVCEEPSAAEILAQLRERTLVAGTQESGQIRFRMLESLREFGGERLTKGEQTRLESRHAAFFLSAAERGNAMLSSGAAARTLDGFEADHDNYRAAFERLDARDRLRFCSEFWKFWEIRGHFAEGSRRLTAALAGCPRSGDLRAKVLSGLGALAYAQGDHAAALSTQEEAVAIAEDLSVAAKARNNLGLTFLRLGRLAEAQASFEQTRRFFAGTGNREGESAALNNLGIVRRRQGDFEGAREALEAAILLDQEVGNQQSLAYALNSLGLVLIALGRRDEAEARLGASLALKRELNDRAGVVSSLFNLGVLAAEREQFPKARRLQCEALELRRELGLRHGILESLGGFAGLALAEGEPKSAAILLGAQIALGIALSAPLAPEEQEQAQKELRAALGHEDFKSALGRGTAMTLEEAIAFALASGSGE